MNTPKHPLAEKFFGALTPRETTGNHTPTRAQLTEPFENRDGHVSVSFLFCGGCGCEFEVTSAGITLLSDEFGIRMPENQDRQYYVHCQRCIQCAERPDGLKVLEIPKR